MNIGMPKIESALLAVIANRFDCICREMTNTLLRSGRSAVLNMARDFSCSLVTGDNQLLAAAEGLPVHVFGSQFLTQAMCDLHADLAEGDAFLHNDVYLGNTHSADHTILVPVFVDGEHLFTACAKAHQADCGNSLPSTYMPFAGDLYEEGALNFPCVRIQRSYQDVDDIIRMCRRRIRVPDQWYGDYLAELGAARIAERRLKELVAKYGRDLMQQFIAEWFDYSERRMIHDYRIVRVAERRDPILRSGGDVPSVLHHVVDRVRAPELPRLGTARIKRDREAQDLPRACKPRGRRDLLRRDEVHRSELVVIAPSSPVREALRHLADVSDRE